MTVAKADLEAQLFEYRKASRALMWFWESSQRLYELICENLNLMKLTIKDVDLEDELDFWQKPKGISSRQAFKDITVSQNNWAIICCTEDNFRMKKNSVCLKIYLTLDTLTTESPENSLSALEIYGWHVKNVRGKAIDEFTNVDDNYDKELTENSVVDEAGNPLEPMSFNIFQDVWAANNKYKGDYAIGLYDLSELVDEDTVLSTVIKDIGNVLKVWETI